METPITAPVSAHVSNQTVQSRKWRVRRAAASPTKPASDAARRAKGVIWEGALAVGIYDRFRCSLAW